MQMIAHRPKNLRLPQAAALALRIYRFEVRSSSYQKANSLTVRHIVNRAAMEDDKGNFHRKTLVSIFQIIAVCEIH
jgi:hypothetical protein